MAGTHGDEESIEGIKDRPIPGMDVGIVNMYDSPNKCHYLVNAIIALGKHPHVIDGVHGNVLPYIKRSPIKHWIFSGSANSVFDATSPQVPDVLSLKDKRFMMICYSMESVLCQLGFPLKQRPRVKEIFRLSIPDDPLFHDIKNPAVLRRTHMCYFPQKSIIKPVELLAQYKGEAMIARYKNTLFVQFHPEKSADGKKLIRNWLQGG